MIPSDFIHPEDASALQQMQNLPGFTAFVKKIMSIGYETLKYGTNMASNIRVTEKQLPKLYQHLPPICEKLGIAEPEFYLEMNPVPNAWTSGDTRIFMTVTSGLVEMMNDDELDAVIAHECGHILCRHVLYHTIAQWLATGLESTGLFNTLTAPIRIAILYWYRKSELSADRAACLVTSPETVSTVMARLAGGPASITSEINMEEWAAQANEYEKIRNSNLWNKTLQIGAVAGLSHPYAAVRVREILSWAESDQYRILKAALEGNENPVVAPVTEFGKTCPNCGQPVEDDWQFCRHCGTKL